MTVEFRILGPIEVSGGNGPIRLGGPKQRGVLAMLLIRVNGVVPVEQLAVGLYGGNAPRTAVAQIRDHISQLRKQLGAAASLIETRAPGYVLHAGPESLDALRFEGMVEAGSVALAHGRADEAARTLREALALWRGPALADFGYESFAQPAITRLEELRLTGVGQRIEADLLLGRNGTLVAELEALVAEHPLREQFRAQLMLALYRSGRPAEAIGHYHAGRRVLIDQFGLEPSAGLRELAGRMLREDPKLVVPEPGARIRNPYKGLYAFGESDAGDFFGREELVRAIVERLREERFIAAVGPSGSGKSSVVLAGVVPALRAGALPGSTGWRIEVATAGDCPIELLEVGGEDVLLVLDQLEEVFTLVEDEQYRAAFLAALARAVRDPDSGLRVVATLRADFYDRPLAYREFGALLRDGVESVLPLSPEELERAIAGPAREVGMQLEEGLLASIVADVIDAPGALPLLQYALTELHERREGAMLTRAAYEKIGGISGALAGRAEGLYRGLDAAGREAVRQLFLRLVTIGDAADTRRRVARRELDSLEVDQARLGLAVDALGSARLLSFDRDARTGETTVEVAHEALLGEWSRLQEWISAARESLRAHRRLTAAAEEWRESGSDPSMLLRGGRLARFEVWAQDSGLAQTELEREYLAASVAAREDEAAVEAARQAREAVLERRSVRRLRTLVVVLAVAALVAAALSVLAFHQSSRSQHEARIATARQLAAASAANADVDPELAILLALRAVETTGAAHALPEAVDALHNSIAATREVRTLPVQTNAVAASADGRVATAGARIGVWNAESGRRLLRLSGPGAPFHDVAFSSDGTRLAAGGDDGTAIVWNAHSGRRLLRLPRPAPGVSVEALAFSPDGTRIAADDGVGDLWFWDVGSGRIERVVGSEGHLCGVAWSPDGRRVATGDCGTHFSPSFGRVWDAATGKLVFRTRPQVGAILTAAFSPDGRDLAAPNRAGFAQIWDTRSGRLRSTFTGHSGEVLAAAYGAGNTVATSGTDGTVRVWDAVSAQQLLVLHGHGGPVRGLAFLRDDSRLVSAGDDGTVRIWDVTRGGSRELLTIDAHRGGVESIIYDPSGKRILTSGISDGKAALWDARSGRRLAAYATVLDPGVNYMAGSGFPPQVDVTSPDEKYGVDLHEGERAFLRLNATGAVVARVGHEPQSVGFDPSSRTLAVGNTDGTVVLWNIRAHRAIRTFAAHKGYVEAIAFSPDGRLLVTGGEDTTTKLWDLRTGQNVLTLTGHTSLVTAIAFSPDGTRLATGSRDGTVRIHVLPVAQLVVLARSRLTRGWSTEACRQYLPGGRCADPSPGVS
jgi:WD40 repeat protein/DNA-binding SARP family transcriptional activator